MVAKKKSKAIDSKKAEVINEYNKYYSSYSDMWAGSERDLFAIKTIGNYLKNYPKTFLDVGCGTGHTVEFFSKNWSDTECWGLDLSLVAIDIAKKKIPNATFVCSSVEDFTPRKFDVVVSLGTLEHVEDYEPMLLKLRELVGGILYVEVPNCINYVISEKVEGFRRLNGGSQQMEWHLYRPTWEKRLMDAGFEIVESIVGPDVYTEFIWILKRAES